MANLRSLMGKKSSAEPKNGKVIALEIYVPVVRVEDKDTTTIGKITKHFSHLYVAFQRLHGKWIVRTKTMKTCMCKLAEEFEMYEAEGREINIVDYFEAHKQKYGEKLRPGHLVSKKSLSIYNQYMTQKHAPVFALTTEEHAEYNEETIERLARIRGESKAAVREVLQKSGLM